MLTAPFLLTRYCWPAMKKQKWGRVVNIASIHALVASPFKVGYISAKHGLIGLTRTAALEGGEHGITVNAICPAYVRTPLVDSQIADQAKANNMSPEEVIEKIMLAPAAVKRLIEPREVAGFRRLPVRRRGRRDHGRGADDGSGLDGAVAPWGWTARQRTSSPARRTPAGRPSPPQAASRTRAPGPCRSHTTRGTHCSAPGPRTRACAPSPAAAPPVPRASFRASPAARGACGRASRAARAPRRSAARGCAQAAASRPCAASQRRNPSRSTATAKDSLKVVSSFT